MDEEADDVGVVIGVSSCSLLSCARMLIADIGDPGNNDKRGDVEGVKGLASGLRLCMLVYIVFGEADSSVDEGVLGG